MKLGYEPRRDSVESSLDQLADIVDQLDFADVSASAASPLEALVSESYTSCPQHHVYEHVAGCIICNDR